MLIHNLISLGVGTETKVRHSDLGWREGGSFTKIRANLGLRVGCDKRGVGPRLVRTQSKSRRVVESIDEIMNRTKTLSDTEKPKQEISNICQ